MKIRVKYTIHKVEELDVDIGDANVEDVMYGLNDPHEDGEFELVKTLPDDAIVAYECDQNGTLETLVSPRV